MVVSDEVEIQHSRQTIFRFVDDLDGREEFLPGGNQRGAVLLRPGIKLNMRDLDSLRADFGCEVDDAGQVVDVFTVNRRVDGQAEAEFARPAREVAFLGEAAFVAGDAIGVFRNDILDRNLDVVEPDGGQALEMFAGQQDARRDEIGVEAGVTAWARIASKSRRAVGSPPERCSCMTPAAAA